MRKFLIVTGLLVVLTACGNDPQAPEQDAPTGGTTSVFHVKTSQGNVECIYLDGGHDGGLSCDWGGRTFR